MLTHLVSHLAPVTWPQEQGSSLNHLFYARFSVTSSLFSAVNSPVFNLPRAHPILFTFKVLWNIFVTGSGWRRSPGITLGMYLEDVFLMNGKFLPGQVPLPPLHFSGWHTRNIDVPLGKSNFSKTTIPSFCCLKSQPDCSCYLMRSIPPPYLCLSSHISEKYTTFDRHLGLFALWGFQLAWDSNRLLSLILVKH